MKAQSFKNHGRYVFMFHIVTYAAIFAVIVGSVINLVNSSKENLYSASLLVLVSLILASLAWFGRRFALKAQDRAIRAEENFRHFILTGKPLDHRLRMGQIIALRFAHDEEFATPTATNTVAARWRRFPEKKLFTFITSDRHSPR